MKEVLNFFLLSSIVFSVIFSGCAATTQRSEPKQNLAAAERVTAERRIFFPNYNFSIRKPPQEWETLEGQGKDELVIWLNREGGSVIEIMVSRAVRNFSYHKIATEFNRITCDLVQQRSPTVTCAIIEEKEVNFNKNKFYHVRIVYQGLSHDTTVKSLIYLHRTGNFVYHFLFMEERHSPLANEMMQSIVFHGNDGQDEIVEKTDVPLSFIDACYYGDLDRVESLLEAGVDINAKNKDGVTALSYASDRGHMVIVQKLLHNNADVNISSNIGSTALMNAAYMGHVKIVSLLIASGADVNTPSNNGTTALMNAAAHGHLEIVEMLLASNADADARDECGLNALWNAISSGHREIVKTLINNGADVNARANDGTTALMNAAFSGNIDMVKMLLAADTDINAIAANGWNALLFAKSRGNFEIVRLLIDEGAMDESLIGPGIFFKR